jgi:hypothetical protein
LFALASCAFLGFVDRGDGVWTKTAFADRANTPAQILCAILAAIPSHQKKIIAWGNSSTRSAAMGVRKFCESLIDPYRSLAEPSRIL